MGAVNAWAKENSFIGVHYKGVRAPNSSSKNPGSTWEMYIDLTR